MHKPSQFALFLAMPEGLSRSNTVNNATPAPKQLNWTSAGLHSVITTWQHTARRRLNTWSWCSLNADILPLCNRRNRKIQTCSTAFVESSHPELIRRLPRCCQTLSCLATRMMKHTFSPLSSLATDAHSWDVCLSRRTKIWVDHHLIWSERRGTKIPLLVFLISIMLPLIRRQVDNLLALSSFVYFCLFPFDSGSLALPHHSHTHTQTHTNTGCTEITAKGRCITFTCNLCKKNMQSCTQLIYTRIMYTQKDTHRCKETCTQVGCSTAPTL